MDHQDAPFVIFDDFLLRMAIKLPHFVLMLQDALLACITVPQSDIPAGTGHGAIIWLRHLYLAKTWQKHREMALLDGELALQLCIDNPNHLTEKLVRLLFVDNAFANLHQSFATKTVQFWADHPVSEVLQSIPNIIGDRNG